METETLSTYEQKRIDNTMDVDISNNDEGSTSPVNKTYEESSESAANQDTAKTKEKHSTQIEMESDCEEEEEEKLLLSPARSDKAYDSDDAALSPPLNRDLDESDNEEDKVVEESENEKLDDKNSGTAQNVDDKSDKNRIDVSDNESRDKEDEKNKDDPLESSEEVKDNASEDKQDVEAEEQTEEDKKEDDSEKGKSNVEAPAEISVEEAEKGNVEAPTEISDEEVEKSNVEAPTEISDEEAVSNVEESKSEKEEKDKADKQDENEKIQTIDSEEEKPDDSKDKKDENEKIQTIDSEEEKPDDSKDKKDENEKIQTIDSEEENTEKPDDSKDKKDENEKIQTIDSEEENKEKLDDSKHAQEKKEDAKETDTKKGQENSDDKNSLLKETLSKPLSDEKEPDVDEEMEMDEDFDPSLLCPELSMEVDEAPVITTSDAPPAHDTDGSKSPLRLYDPIFSTFVDEMTGAEVDFNLTAEELELKAKTYGPKNPIQFTKIHCTACNIHLGSALDGQGNRFVHPLLKVLICKKCYHFYTSGEFEKDEDGSELYCRWCGQGGQVMCCSNCEMVFCKKCIRINFDRRKLTDITRSDDWMCFNCNPSQLIHLRIHCAEFMEYVQAELRRAGTSANVEAFMNTDYCQCCIPQKKKAADTPTTSQPKKRRRYANDEDPDYDPSKERDDLPVQVVTPVASTSQQSPQVKTPTFTPRAAVTAVRPAAVRPMGVQPRPAMGTPRPRAPVVTTPGVRNQGQTGFVKIMPGGVRMTGPQPTTSATRLPALRPIHPTTQMKHEWFEKTVRAAARVNSNLSYTLTQLNRAQANATSVEALAVVHNKLQEILSSSINSLIQIRKNLRTEFIAGIKNLRFPAKATPPTPATSSTSKDDDDVIFVPSDPPPPPLVPVTKTPTITNNKANNKINLPPSISLVKKTASAPSPSTPSTSSVTIRATGSGGGVAKKSTSAAADDSTRPKGFLRVKSFSALQNVTSECITIPDDPPEEDEVKSVEEIDPLDVPDPLDDPKVEEPAANSNGMTNGDDKVTKNSNDDEKRKEEINKDVETEKGDAKTEENTNGDRKRKKISKDVESEKADAETDEDAGKKEKDDGETEKETAKKRKRDAKKSEEVDEKSEKEDDVSVKIDAIKGKDELEKFKAPKILLERSGEIDAMIKTKYQLVNGSSD